MSDDDPYRLLGLSPSATQDDVRSAYRAMARAHHPDAGGEGHQMAALNAAWRILRDPRSRAAYDARQRRQSAQLVTPAAPTTPTGGQQRAWTPDPGPTVLDFGRYAGSTIEALAMLDPDYLEWLARMPVGRPHRVEIESALARARSREAAAGDRRRRSG